MIKKILEGTCKLAFGIGVGVGLGATIWVAGITQGASAVLIAEQHDKRKEVEEEEEENLEEIE